MDEPIEAVYFDWLRAKVIEVRDQNYYDLMRILYSTEFVWVILGDKNRKDDGLELRQYFLNESGFECDNIWFNEPCSILEMILGISDRAAFQTNMSLKDWFWIFIANLGLEEYRRVSRSDEPIIEEILYTFVWRTYYGDGRGGLFPMHHPKNDQRKVECWYQLSEYLDDQGLE